MSIHTSQVNSDYQAFLKSKRLVAPACGIEVAEEALHPRLFGFQKLITRWALKRGKAAVFAATGTGKTAVQCSFAEQISRHTGGNVLILAPLAVSQQTVREAAKFGITVHLCRRGEDVRPGVNVTNYEMISHFDPAQFVGIVIDESSRLRAFEGVQRQQFTRFAERLPYRLCCTATPAPNDLIELGTHSEFLGIMGIKETAALFFRQEQNVHEWRLKAHAVGDFYRWLASWSVAVRMPSDLGFPDEGFVLPPLDIEQVVVECDQPVEGQLFAVEARSLSEVRAAQRASLEERVAAAAARVNGEANEPWLCWCWLNAESEALTRAIPGAVEVRGSESVEEKERKLMAFVNGEARVLVTKASIAGHGLNLQHCARMAFVGQSYSWESYYQAVRRCWRFGQQRGVHCFVITSQNEGRVVEEIRRKEAQAEGMMNELVSHMKELQMENASRDEMDYSPATRMKIPDWLVSQKERVVG